MLSIPVQLVVENEYLIGEIFSYAVSDASIIMRLSLVSKAWQQHVEEFARTLLDSYSLNPKISQFFQFPFEDTSSIDAIGEIYLSIRCVENILEIPRSSFPNLALTKDVATLTPQERGNGVKNAAKKGYEGIVKWLLASGTIGEDIRGWSVLDATKGGHQGIVKFLLVGGPIAQDDLGSSVRRAAGDGCQEIVELLLANGPISEEDRGLAAKRAEEDGHQGIVDLLNGQRV